MPRTRAVLVPEYQRLVRTTRSGSSVLMSDLFREDGSLIEFAQLEDGTLTACFVMGKPSEASLQNVAHLWYLCATHARNIASVQASRASHLYVHLWVRGFDEAALHLDLDALHRERAIAVSTIPKGVLRPRVNGTEEANVWLKRLHALTGPDALPGHIAMPYTRTLVPRELRRVLVSHNLVVNLETRLAATDDVIEAHVRLARAAQAATVARAGAGTTSVTEAAVDRAYAVRVGAAAVVAVGLPRSESVAAVAVERVKGMLLVKKTVQTAIDSVLLQARACDAERAAALAATIERNKAAVAAREVALAERARLVAKEEQRRKCEKRAAQIATRPNPGRDTHAKPVSAPAKPVKCTASTKSRLRRAPTRGVVTGVVPGEVADGAHEAEVARATREAEVARATREAEQAARLREQARAQAAARAATERQQQARFEADTTEALRRSLEESSSSPPAPVASPSPTIQAGKPPVRRASICHFYHRGVCKNGTDCPYVHAELPRSGKRAQATHPPPPPAPAPPAPAPRYRPAVVPATAPPRECAICFAEEGRDWMAEACGHVPVCGDCAAQLDACPICRAPTRFRKLYF